MSEENGTFYASFQPEEAGEWKIHVTYDGQDIEHSPFKCMVFNPRAIVVSFSFLSAGAEICQNKVSLFWEI